MRQLRKTAVVAIILVVLAVSAAEAASTLTTALVLRLGAYFDCNIVNAGTTAIRVVIQAIDEQGKVDASKVEIPVPPGQGITLEVPDSVGSPRLYCKFTLTQGNKTTVRASYCVEDPTGPFCTATGDAY